MIQIIPLETVQNNSLIFHSKHEQSRHANQNAASLFVVMTSVLDAAAPRELCVGVGRATARVRVAAPRELFISVGRATGLFGCWPAGEWGPARRSDS